MTRRASLHSGAYTFDCVVTNLCACGMADFWSPTTLISELKRMEVSAKLQRQREEAGADFKRRSEAALPPSHLQDRIAFLQERVKAETGERQSGRFQDLAGLPEKRRGGPSSCTSSREPHGARATMALRPAADLQRSVQKPELEEEECLAAVVCHEPHALAALAAFLAPQTLSRRCCLDFARTAWRRRCSLCSGAPCRQASRWPWS